MKASYKGYTIEAWREESLGGGDYLYWAVTRDSDGYLAHDGFNEDGHSELVRQRIAELKRLVDTELASDDPWDEKADEPVRGFVCGADDPSPESAEAIRSVVTAAHDQLTGDPWDEVWAWGI